MPVIAAVGHLGIEQHILIRDAPPQGVRGRQGSKLETHLAKCVWCLGGSLTFATEMATHLGALIKPVASVGTRGAIARSIIAHFQSLSITAKSIHRDGRTNSFCSVWRENQLQRDLYISISSTLSFHALRRSIDDHVCGAIIYQAERNSVLDIVAMLRAKGISVALNCAPMPMCKSMEDWHWLKSIDLFILNEQEFLNLIVTRSISEGCSHLLTILTALDIAAKVVVTRGRRGPIAINNDGVVEMAHNELVRFPLGGGDMLTFALFSRLLDGEQFYQALDKSILNTTNVMKNIAPFVGSGRLYLNL